MIVLLIVGDHGGIMAHQPTVFSPAGTPLLQRTVAELVTENPARSRIFQKHKIGFCCEGSTTLAEACKREGLSALEISAATSGAGIWENETPWQFCRRGFIPRSGRVRASYHRGINPLRQERTEALSKARFDPSLRLASKITLVSDRYVFWFTRR